MCSLVHDVHALREVLLTASNRVQLLVANCEAEHSMHSMSAANVIRR